MEYDDLLRLVSQNIRSLRLKKGLSQEQMAEHGFNYRHYQKIESGQQRLKLETLFRLSQIFKCQMVDFFKKK